MQPLKKNLPESIRAIARNPNIDLKSIGIHSKEYTGIQHHIVDSNFKNYSHKWIQYNDNRLTKI